MTCRAAFRPEYKSIHVFRHRVEIFYAVLELPQIIARKREKVFAFDKTLFVILEVLPNLMCLNLIRLSKRISGDDRNTFVNKLRKGNRGGNLAHMSTPLENCSIPLFRNRKGRELEQRPKVRPTHFPRRYCMVNGLPPSECDCRTARVQKIGLDLNEKPAFTVAESAFGSAVQGRENTQA